MDTCQELEVFTCNSRGCGFLSEVRGFFFWGGGMLSWFCWVKEMWIGTTLLGFRWTAFKYNVYELPIRNLLGESLVCPTSPQSDMIVRSPEEEKKNRSDFCTQERRLRWLTQKVLLDMLVLTTGFTH